MSDLSVVRTIISDLKQYGVSTAVGDGSTVEFLTPNSPIFPGSAKVYVNNVLRTLTTDYLLDEDTGLVTFISAPGVNSGITVSCMVTLLTDAQIQDLLDLEGGTVQLAAADALDIIASSETMIQKKLKLLDLETDGPAVAKSLREHAAVLRKTLFDPALDEPTFDVIEQINDAPGLEEKIIKDWMRGS